MNIQGLDYNTQREMLQLPEYGREIQKMVEVAVGLPTKEERLRCANAIVRLMETKVPQIRDNSDYKQTLWDHLYLMSGKQLDIDWPCDVSNAEKIYSKPQPIPLPQSKIRLRHYGKLVEELCEKLRDMPEGEERDMLVRLTANQMKRDLALWGHGSMDDERVADDLARMTDGVIQLDLNSHALKSVSMTGDEPKRPKRRK
jgi:hypothetical protein